MKYVKLNTAHTEWDSAVYSMKPRQIRRLNDDQARKQHWFPVKELFEPAPDRDLYRNVVSSWEIVEGVVEIKYVPELVNLSHRKQILTDRVIRIRDEKLDGGLVFQGTELDTDAAAVQNVSGAVLSVLLDPSFTTRWVTADNSRITLGAEEIKALGKAFAKHREVNIMFARDLKDSIEASETPETFDVREGWPSNEYGAVEA